jgi:7,8-dihydroneopterin aldolase/epimerase/oxygenase
MGTDIRKAAASDHIDDTLDYKKYRSACCSSSSESEFQLVETLIDRIAQIILTEFDVPVVKVR